MRGDQALLVYGVAFLAWVAIFGFIGYAVGKGKGRGGLGWALGCLLGFIGVIIVAVLPPTPESERLRYPLITGNDPSRPGAPAGPTDDELRQQAVAEVVRRDPALASASDPDSLRVLAAATAAVMEELRVKAALDAVQRQQEEEAATALLEAQRRHDRDKAEKERQAASERAALEAASRREEREERVSALPPARRWIARHRALTVGLLVLCVAAIAIPITIVSVGAARDRAAADQVAAEQQSAAAAQAALLREEGMVIDGTADPSIRLDWARRPDVQPAALTALAQDESATVRTAVAERPDLTPELFTILVRDTVSQVRAATAENEGLPQVNRALLASDPSGFVRSRLAQRADLSLNLIQQLAGDRDLKVRYAVAVNETAPRTVLRRLCQRT